MAAAASSAGAGLVRLPVRQGVDTEYNGRRSTDYTDFKIDCGNPCKVGNLWIISLPSWGRLSSGGAGLAPSRLEGWRASPEHATEHMLRNSLWPVLLATLLGACQQSAPARVEAPADSVAGEIAFEWAGPSAAAILVPVHINGRGPYPFVLDTGATLTCVDDALAAELSLPEARGQIGFGAGVGGAGRMRLLDTDSLRVGAATAEELPVCALDLSAVRQAGIEFQGLLGLNFLRSFRMAVDFERAVLSLQEP